jgi:hypothetical protein
MTGIIGLTIGLITRRNKTNWRILGRRRFDCAGRREDNLFLYRWEIPGGTARLRDRKSGEQQSQ